MMWHALLYEKFQFSQRNKGGWGWDTGMTRFSVIVFFSTMVCNTACLHIWYNLLQYTEVQVVEELYNSNKQTENQRQELMNIMYKWDCSYKCFKTWSNSQT